MAQAKTAFDPQTVIDRYFELIHDLRNGQQEAVEGLLELWNEDGVFEFAGAEPVTGIYKGRNAIHVLYKNRLAACGMPLRLAGVEGARATAKIARDVALGIVDTKISRTRTLTPKTPKGGSGGQQVAVGWTTVIGTSDESGFQVTGSHTFVFKSGKINSLKVTVSPKAALTPGLALEGLAVADIGRLSLAAWCVV